MTPIPILNHTCTGCFVEVLKQSTVSAREYSRAESCHALSKPCEQTHSTGQLLLQMDKLDIRQRTFPRHCVLILSKAFVCAPGIDLQPALCSYTKLCVSVMPYFTTRGCAFLSLWNYPGTGWGCTLSKG